MQSPNNSTDVTSFFCGTDSLIVFLIMGFDIINCLSISVIFAAGTKEMSN